MKKLTQEDKDEISRQIKEIDLIIRRISAQEDVLIQQAVIEIKDRIRGEIEIYTHRRSELVASIAPPPPTTISKEKNKEEKK